MSPQAQGTDNHEDGIGMIEIVVAMFVLAVLALAFLPVLTQGLVATQQNSRVATASQVLATQMDAARSARGTCASVSTFTDTAVAPALIGGQSFQISRAAISDSGSVQAASAARCTSWIGAGTARVRVTVSTVVNGATKVLAQSDTRLFVGSTP